MANLLDLPDELMVQVISYLISILKDTPIPESKSTCFKEWTAESTKTVRGCFRANQGLRPLTIACRRLHGLAKPLMYSDVSLIHGHKFRDFSDLHLRRFLRVLRTEPNLGRYIRSVAAKVDDDAIEALGVLFCLPVPHTLWISNFNDCYVPTLPKGAGTSPVKALRLLQCGAHEQPLTAILSWPRALEELCYEVEQGEWGGQVAGEALPEWECAALVRALQSQKNSLKHLSITRRFQSRKGLGCSPPIDLSNFTALKSLSLFFVFLMESEPAKSLHERLPPQLELLEVYYDDVPYGWFAEAGELQWLTNLALMKPTHLPALQSVVVFSPGSLEETGGHEENHGVWVPPSHVEQAFDQAGIALSLQLHYHPYQAIFQL